MYGNGAGRHERELHELLETHGRLVRTSGSRDVWRLDNGETIVVPSSGARVSDPHSWKNALASVKRALAGHRRHANPYDDGSSSASPNPPRKPVIYQGILRSATPDVLEQMNGAHAIVADEVAKLFLSDPERSWDPDDLPNIMPPFRRYFVEWDVPTREGPRMSGGILFTSERLDAPEKVRAVRTADSSFSRIIPDVELLGCTLVEADLFLVIGTHEVMRAGTVMYFVDIDGRMKSIGRNGGFFIIVADARAKTFINSIHVLRESMGPHSSPYEAFVASVFNMGLLATCFMHSRNVSLSKREAKPSEVRRRLLKPGQRTEPTVTYHVLEIEPMKKILRTEGRSGEVGLKKALHTVRGHFKTFADKGMFGRDDLRGSFWFEEHSRGDPDRGVVIKDYSIGPIDPDAQGPTANPQDLSRSEFDALNRRRIELINKKHTGGGLNGAESKELAGLTAITRDFIDREYPLPPMPPEMPDATSNPSVPCPGCGRGVKDTATRCWNCGLVFQSAGRERPMFGRSARSGFGMATNPRSRRDLED